LIKCTYCYNEIDHTKDKYRYHYRYLMVHEHCFNEIIDKAIKQNFKGYW